MHIPTKHEVRRGSVRSGFCLTDEPVLDCANDEQEEVDQIDNLP
jgi:hypothetical protein